MNAPEESLDERVKASLIKLSAVSVKLNAASDELGRLIGQLESTFAQLNLGIEAWVEFDAEADPSPDKYWHCDLGYAKLDGKWGVAIRTVVERQETGDFITYNAKLFNEAARELRASAVEKIPDLIDELSNLGVGTEKRIRRSAGIVGQVVTVITAVIPSADRRK